MRDTVLWFYSPNWTLIDAQGKIIAGQEGAVVSFLVPGGTSLYSIEATNRCEALRCYLWILAAMMTVPCVVRCQERVAAGLTVGAPLTEPLHTGSAVQQTFSGSAPSSGFSIQYRSAWKPPFGAVLLFPVSSRFQVEGSLLYRGLSYASTGTRSEQGVQTSRTTEGTRGYSLELPIMLIYRISGVRAVTPYRGAGAVGQRLGGLKQTSDMTVLGIESNYQTNKPAELVRRWNVGFAAEAGIGRRIAGPVQLRLGVRYTVYGLNEFNDHSFPGSDLLRTNQNQIDVLLGVTF